MSTFVIGLSISMLLFLLAAGLTLIFGMLRIINFAHGALYMFGAYLAYQVSASSGSFWLALLVAPLVMALIGALTERWLLRPIYSMPHEFQLLITFGMILVIEEMVHVFWGLNGRNIATPAALAGGVEWLGTTFAKYRLFVIVLGAAMIVSLLLGIERSRLGLIVRACSVSPTMAASLGVKVNTVRTAVFAAGAALAGLAGAVAGPMLPIQLQMGTTIILDCFIVVILGGLGNIRGAVLGALLIGMTRAYGQQWLPEWIDILTYSVLIATLLLRPQGLFSKKERLA